MSSVKNSILISIIVPIYNTAEYLERCVDSIVNQTYSKLEIILVDDGSTDSSLKLAHALAKKDCRIKVLTQSNSGAGGARNRGISEANGEYLMFVDSDDYIDQLMVEKMLKSANKHQADLVVCDMYRQKQSGQLNICKGHKNALTKNNVFADKAVLFIGDTPCDKLYHNSLWKHSVCFSEKCWYEDFRTITKIVALAKRVAYVNEPLYYYCVHSNSTMNNRNYTKNLEIIEAMSDITSWFEQNELRHQYESELEMLCVNHVLVGAGLRVAEIGYFPKIMQQFVDYTKSEFVDFRKNRYLREFQKFKNWKIVFKLMNSGYFLSLYFYAKIRKLLLKLKHRVK